MAADRQIPRGKAGHQIHQQPRTAKYRAGLPFTLSGNTLRHEPPKEYKPHVPVLPKTIEPPTNDPVTIDELTSFMCAVVVEDRPPRYCGCAALKHQRFRMCAYHASYMVEKWKARQGNQERPKQIAHKAGGI